MKFQRPFSTYASDELYTTHLLKPAAILESIVKNHPFVGGNKRTGFLTCNAIMLNNFWKLNAAAEEAYDFVIQVASSHMEFEDIASWIELHSISL